MWNNGIINDKHLVIDCKMAPYVIIMREVLLHRIFSRKNFNSPVYAWS